MESADSRGRTRPLLTASPWALASLIRCDVGVKCRIARSLTTAIPSVPPAACLFCRGGAVIGLGPFCCSMHSSSRVLWAM